MSLFRPSFEEKRSIDGTYLTRFDQAGDKITGNNVQSALRLVPLYSATAMIADAIACMPFSGYSNRGGSRRKLAPQPDLTQTPHPNPIFTRAEWLHQFTTSFLLRGNSYGLITALDQQGRVSKVQWLNPDGIKVNEERPGLPVYTYNGNPLDLASVIHVPWYPCPGSVVGLSPIQQFKTQIETSGGASKYGNDWFKHGSMPSGHLKYDAGPLDPRQASVIKDRFKASVAGNDVFVSGNDWDWKALSVTPNEAQFLETIKAGANEIAAIYRVDPADIGGEAANSLTYATLELNQIKFQVRALQPIFTRLELHLSRLMPDQQYYKFNPDVLIRTDTKSRAEAHEINLRSGMETQDEGRALEDKQPLTPAEVEAWKENYSKAPVPAATPSPDPKGGA